MKYFFKILYGLAIFASTLAFCYEQQDKATYYLVFALLFYILDKDATQTNNRTP